MIISRTPFRISLFGGGTDYPTWFREHGGAVIGTAIDGGWSDPYTRTAIPVEGLFVLALALIRFLA